MSIRPKAFEHFPAIPSMPGAADTDAKSEAGVEEANRKSAKSVKNIEIGGQDV